MHWRGPRDPRIYDTRRGENHYNWKGGIAYRSGYVFIYRPDHPSANCHGYVRRSRLVMEEHLGRFLSEIEVVHHINRKTNDDRFENLELFANQSDHMASGHKDSSLKGRKFSEEHKNNLRKAWEKREKISWNKGTKGMTKPNSTSFKKGFVPWNKGKKFSQESIQKMIESQNKRRMKELISH